MAFADKLQVADWMDDQRRKAKDASEGEIRRAFDTLAVAVTNALHSEGFEEAVQDLEIGVQNVGEIIWKQ